jgi:hypothetical protein
MTRKIGQSLAAAAIILTVSSVTTATASHGGRGDRNTCDREYGKAMACLDKYEKEGIEVYCVTSFADTGAGTGTSVSCDWEHAKHPTIN